MTTMQETLDRVGSNPRTANAVVAGAALLCTLLSVGALYWWLDQNPSAKLVAEVPGTDGLPPGGRNDSVSIDLTGTFVSFDGKPATLEGAWPSFRGPDRQNIARDNTPLASSWAGGSPKVLWKLPVGDGYAAPSVLNGRVYLADYDVENRADTIRCLSLEDGSEIWRRSYPIKIKRNHGMSRTIPAVTDQYLVSMGPKCHVVCLDAARGDFRWGIDLQRDYGTNEPLWYAGQCPLIVGGDAILAPCGPEVMMMAVDCETGAVEWTTPNPYKWDMSHSSIVPMTLAGKAMYLYSAVGGVVAVSAEPENVGELLWQVPRTGNVIAPSPVQVGDDLVFSTSGYGKGSILLRVTVDAGGKVGVEEVYNRGPVEVLACEQQTPIFKDGLIYGIMPKDAGALKEQFVCYAPDGQLVWSSGQDRRFGLGPFLLADDKFYIVDDEANLTMLDATSGEYVQLGQANILDGHDSWGPLALAGSRLLMRDMNTLACVELGANS